MGRVLTHSINGAANTGSVVYDSLGRVTSTTNLLGTFTFAYVSGTSQVDYVDYPNQQRLDLDYWPNVPAVAGTGNGDRRLKQIKNIGVGPGGSGSVLSQFDYGYDVTGQITEWTQSHSGMSQPQQYRLEYDRAGRLVEGILRNTVTSAVLQESYFGFDKASNRTAKQNGQSLTGYQANSTNQLVSSGGSGRMTFRGTVNEAALVTVGGQSATVDAQGNWKATVDVAAGASSIPIEARDGNDNVTAKDIQVTVSGAAPRTFIYDDNGNLTDNGAGQTYEWDAADRLSAINYAGTSPVRRTEFVYDGLSRWAKILEREDGVVTSEKRYVWQGLSRAEERNSANAVTKRYLGGGEQQGSTALYYTVDHLGSVRELVDGSGSVRARYDYDVWGERIKLSGDLDTETGFTGHYAHAASGLYFAPFRAYNPETGRWISRDPIREQGGLNVYAYVINDPVSFADQTGLIHVLVIIGGSALVGGILGYLLTPEDECDEWAKWKGAGAGFVAGAVGGLVGAALIPMGPLMAGFIGGAAGGYAGVVLSTGSFKPAPSGWVSIAGAAVLGASSGQLGGRITDGMVKSQGGRVTGISPSVEASGDLPMILPGGVAGGAVDFVNGVIDGFLNAAGEERED